MFDFLHEDSKNIALVIRRTLEPIGGYPIKPPTYPDEGKKPPRMYTCHEDGSVTLDSVGSSANRLEEVFERYPELIPQHELVLDNGEKFLFFKLPHRLTTAILRCSSMQEEINKVFQSLKQKDPIPLAKLDPLSIVFGCWDSSGVEGVKIERIISSQIIGYDAKKANQNTQYSGSPLPDPKYFKDWSAKDIENFKSNGNFNQAPNADLGGVICSRIEQVLSLNLRMIQRWSDPVFRSYILSLCLVPFVSRPDLHLRSGCHLKVVNFSCEITFEDGQVDASREMEFSLEDVLKYARGAAASFGISNPIQAKEDAKALKEWKGVVDKRVAKKGKKE